MAKMINTSQCEKCRYGTIDDSNKARVTIYCADKKKKYSYGQRIPCEGIKKKEGD